MTQKQFTNIVYGYTDIYGYDEANNHIAVTISNGIFYFYYENGLLMTFDLLLNNGKNVVIKSYTSGQLYSSRYLLRDNLGTICYMEDEYYEEVRNIVKILNYIQEADVDDEIPPTSLVREFIGGNSFYR